MKTKIFLTFAIIFASLAFASCSSDDDENSELSQDTAVTEIASMLIGTFSVTQTSSTTNTDETTEMTFTPYPSPISESWDNGNGSKDVLMYGTCRVVKYYNDHLLETSKEWKYNISVPYTGAQARLILYPDVYGLTESHTITKLSVSSFSLDGVTYTKQ